MQSKRIQYQINAIPIAIAEHRRVQWSVPREFQRGRSTYLAVADSYGSVFIYSLRDVPTTIEPVREIRRWI